MTIENVSLFLVGGAVSALITFFFTNISNRKATKDLINDVVIAHEKLYHSINPESSLKEHIVNCKANRKIDKMEKALIYIVSQLGGDPKELGLIDL